VRINQVAVSAGALGVEYCYQIVAEAARHDCPDLPVQSARSFGAWLSAVGDPRHAWLATDDAGQPAGCYVLTLPTRENLDMAICLLAVAPRLRRAGVGSALRKHCAAQATLAGRTRLAGGVFDGSPGAAFAAATGAKAGIPFALRQLDIGPGLAVRLVGLRADAELQAAGYSTAHWLGATPERYIADSMRLSAAMADAPTDSGVAPQLWDADRIRAFERTMSDGGQQIYSVCACHDATGQMVAITQVTVDRADPRWAHQGITAVIPEHRGHRLGLLVKVEMVELLADLAPLVRHVVTHNAAANRHMVAINEQFGYQVRKTRRDWELDLPAARSSGR